jgi:ribA/ribD-fused uncharacterized protein
MEARVVKETNPSVSLYFEKKDIDESKWAAIYTELTCIADFISPKTTISSLDEIPPTRRDIFKGSYPYIYGMLSDYALSEHIFFYSHDPVKAALNSGNSDYHVFSNWAWVEFVLDGVKFKSVEQYMMWNKAKLFGDETIAQKILEAGIGLTSSKISSVMGTIKKLGRQVQNFDEETWAANRYGIVLKGVVEKFKQNEKPKLILLSTGKSHLYEAAPRDKIWGIGISASTARNKVLTTNKPFSWPGKNLLGKALEEARNLIKTN